MTIIQSDGFITVKLTDGTTAVVLSDCDDWNSTLTSMEFTDSDGSKYQWDPGTQSFLIVP